MHLCDRLYTGYSVFTLNKPSVAPIPHFDNSSGMTVISIPFVDSTSWYCIIQSKVYSIIMHASAQMSAPSSSTTQVSALCVLLCVIAVPTKATNKAADDISDDATALLYLYTTSL